VPDVNVDRSANTTIACGLLTSAIGLLPILMALGIITPDQKPGQDNAPAWVVIAAGLIFVIGGVAVTMQTLINGRDSPNGDLPATTPRWLYAIYALMILAMVGGLGTVSSWVAFGAGDRHCTGSATFFGAFEVGDTVCRSVFGFGAIMVWITLLWMAVFSAKRLFARGWRANQLPGRS
jgi:hypothetical protein